MGRPGRSSLPSVLRPLPVRLAVRLGGIGPRDGHLAQRPARQHQPQQKADDSPHVAPHGIRNAREWGSFAEHQSMQPSGRDAR